MKEYLIEWETDYCDDFPERRGQCTVKANSIEDAEQEFYKIASSKAIIINVTERNK